MAKTTTHEGQSRGAALSLTLTAQWASAEGGVTIKGLLVSRWEKKVGQICIEAKEPIGKSRKETLAL